MSKLLFVLILITVFPLLDVIAQKPDTVMNRQGDETLTDSVPSSNNAHVKSTKGQTVQNDPLLARHNSLAYEINSLKEQIRYTHQLHFLVSGAIVLILIVLGLLTHRSFSKMRKRISTFDNEVKKLSLQLANLSKPTTPDSPPVSTTQEVDSPSSPSNPSEIIKTPSAETIYYFGGPSKEGDFLTEYQSNTMVSHLSLFEFTISPYDPSVATFTPIPNEYTVRTFVYNLETFEKVCEIYNFSPNACYLQIDKAGKAILQGGIWKVTDKAIIQLS